MNPAFQRLAADVLPVVPHVLNGAAVSIHLRCSVNSGFQRGGLPPQLAGEEHFAIFAEKELLPFVEKNTLIVNNHSATTSKGTGKCINRMEKDMRG